MFVIAILLVFNGQVKDKSEWHEHYSTMAECNAALPNVARQIYVHPGGGSLIFNCILEEKGA